MLVDILYDSVVAGVRGPHAGSQNKTMASPVAAAKCDVDFQGM